MLPCRESYAESAPGHQISIIRRFAGYVVTGGTAAGVDAGGFTLLVAHHVAIAPAATGSFCAAAVVNYLLTSRFVFKHSASMRHFALFFAGALVGLGINVSITVAFSGAGMLPPVVAKLGGIGAAVLVNFTINYGIVFRRATAPRRA